MTTIVSMKKFLVGCGVVACFLARSAFAETIQVRDMESAEWKAIKPALIDEYRKVIGIVVALRLDELRVGEGWAYARVRARQPRDGQLDFKTVKSLAGLQQNDPYDGEGFGLLRRQGRKWKSVAFFFGTPTSTILEKWRKEHKLPAKLIE